MFPSSFGRCKHGLRLFSNFRRDTQRAIGSSSRPSHASSSFWAFSMAVGFATTSWTLFPSSQTRMDGSSLDLQDSSNRVGGPKPLPETQQIFIKLIRLWCRSVGKQDSSKCNEILGHIGAMWLYEYARRQTLEQKSTGDKEVLLILSATQSALLCFKPTYHQGLLKDYYSDQEKMTEEFAELQSFYMNQITSNRKDMDITKATPYAKAVVLGIIATRYIRGASEGAFDTYPDPQSLPEAEYVQSFQKSRYRRLNPVEKVMIHGILVEAIEQILLERRPFRSKEREDLVEELASLGINFSHNAQMDLIRAGTLSFSYLRDALLN